MKIAIRLFFAIVLPCLYSAAKSQDTPMERAIDRKISSADSMSLIRAFTQLKNALYKMDDEDARKLCLPNIRYYTALLDSSVDYFSGESKLVSTKEFIQQFHKQMSEKWFKQMLDSGKSTITVTYYPDWDPQYFGLKKGARSVVYDVKFGYKKIIGPKRAIQYYFPFRFVRVGEQFKFIGLPM